MFSVAPRSFSFIFYFLLFYELTITDNRRNVNKKIENNKNKINMISKNIFKIINYLKIINKSDKIRSCIEKPTLGNPRVINSQEV